MFQPTHHAYHEIHTPRLIIRSAIPTDAQAIADLRSNPKNNPYTPVEPDLSATVYENRIRDWTVSASQGKNAFMVIILRDTASSSSSSLSSAPTPVEGQEGTLIGFGGFNSLEPGPSLHDPTTEAAVIGDTGVMIDHLQWRKGYAREALCATVEYGLYVLGCEHITIGTAMENEPWRGLMRSVGLGFVEQQQDIRREGFPQFECVYRFGRGEWEKAREEMIARGVWMLDTNQY